MPSTVGFFRFVGVVRLLPEPSSSDSVSLSFPPEEGTGAPTGGSGEECAIAVVDSTRLVEAGPQEHKIYLCANDLVRRSLIPLGTTVIGFFLSQNLSDDVQLRCSSTIAFLLTL